MVNDERKFLNRALKPLAPTAAKASSEGFAHLLWDGPPHLLLAAIMAANYRRATGH
jgi:hypothetical protein